MSRKSSTSIMLAVLSILIAVPSLTALPAYADSRSPWGANYFPNVPLVTQDGKTVHFYSDLLKGKVVVINFIYTKCADSCPMETAKLAQVQRLLGDRVGRDVFFYSISINTERDTPTELKAYADKFHVKPGWLFLTGEKADVEQVRKKLGQAARPGENGLTGHSTTITIGNEETGQWMQASSMDDTTVMAVRIGDWLSSWRHQTASKSYTEAHIVDTDNGTYLFRTRCAACHTIGHGDSVGPDLFGVTNIRDHVWLSRFISAPDKLLADKDPIATALYTKYNQIQMPNLRLSGPDVDSLIAFIDAQSAKARPQEHSSSAPSAPSSAKDNDHTNLQKAGK